MRKKELAKAERALAKAQAKLAELGAIARFSTRISERTRSSRSKRWSCFSFVTVAPRTPSGCRNSVLRRRHHEAQAPQRAAQHGQTHRMN
jgi:hypothetical protein